jgi:cation transport regulator
MPYRDITDLPPRIRDQLPEHAQEIFLEAFNHAWEQYAAPGKRHPGSSLEETANPLAAAGTKDYGATPAFLRKSEQIGS